MVAPPDLTDESPAQPALAPGGAGRGGRGWRWSRAGLWLATAGVLWAGLILFAVTALDGPLARWVHDRGIDLAFRARGTWGRTLSEFMKTPGETYFAIVVGVAVFTFHRRRLEAATFLLLATLTSALNTVGKYTTGRLRPFRDNAFHDDPMTWDLFRGGWDFVTQKNLSFPSGHTAQAFAVATAVTLLFPRWGWVALFAAAMTGTERILSNSHYLSDVIAGAGLGACGALLVWSLARGRLVDELPDLAKST